MDVKDVNTKASALSAAAGDTLQSAARTLRERVSSEGMGGTAVEKVAGGLADRLESAGWYLQENNLAAIAEDVAGIIRRYPIQSLLVGAAVGFLIARIGRRGS